MTELLERIEQEARRLPRAERERLILDLLAELDDRPLNAIDQAWIEEAERRFDELTSGQVKGIAADAALKEIRRELKCQE